MTIFPGDPMTSIPKSGGRDPPQLLPQDYNAYGRTNP